MKRVLVIAASAMSLTACSSLPSWMQFDLGKSVPAATTMQFESEPAGAEARTSLGQTCRTPCSIGVNASDFTVTFALAGYQPQTVPVRLVASTDSNRDPNSEVEGPRLVPNPVFVQLQPAAPPPVAHKSGAEARADRHGAGTRPCSRAGFAVAAAPLTDLLGHHICGRFGGRKLFGVA